MKPSVLYARVSSKEQSEGYSIPAQLKLLREYAHSNAFKVLHEFVDVEAAKTTGRKRFGEMVKFLEESKDCNTVIAEKTDRLYRNFLDSITLEDLGVEIHLPKEAQIIGKNSRSQTKLMHGFQVLIARNFIDNLREEVRKGMREKAEQGIFPTRPPLGYRNNKAEHTIEADPSNAPVAKRIFELYGTGEYSLRALRKQIRIETGKTIQKGYLQKILRNRFYSGVFVWDGVSYRGTHPLIIDPEIYERVQRVFSGNNRPKYRKHEFAFSGLLTCALDQCTVTAEIKKAKYIYYHCTGYRGKCGLPYMPEKELGERLGEVLRNIYVPDSVVSDLCKSLAANLDNLESEKKNQRQLLEQRIAALTNRIDQIYLDKLDGKITEEFWLRKSSEWQSEQQQLALTIRGLERPTTDLMLNARRTLELANKACFLYFKQEPAEQAKLLKMVLSNCGIDAASLYPTYKKPFDMIFQRAKWKNGAP